MQIRTWILATALGGIAVLGSEVQMSAARTAPAPREFTVTMANMAYGKLPAGLKVGDVIIWVNRDTVPHTATARDRSFDVRVNQGQMVRMTLKKAGTFSIYCIYHPAMRATMTVAA